MISVGITAQVSTVSPRGVLSTTRCHEDDDDILISFIAFDVDGDQLLSSPFVSESESFFAASLPRVLNAGFPASDDRMFAPAFRGDQVIAPLNYFASDVFLLPSISSVVAPGTVWPNLYVIDDAIFAPFIVARGSLRPNLANDVEELFEPAVTAPLTLKPVRYADSDATFAPVLFRNTLFAHLVNDMDVVYPPARTSAWAFGAALVTDGDSIYAVTTLMSLFAGVLVTANDVVYSVSLSGGSPTMQPIVLSDVDAVYAPAIGNISTALDSGNLVNATLSNSGLTATHSSTANNSGARSNSYQSTGKFYFEVTMTTIHGANDCAGIILQTGTQTELVTSGHSCVAVYKSTGPIFANNTSSGKSLGAIAAGDVIGCAIDLTARKAWLRKNGGNWNGLALTSENPNTGLGGVTIAAGAFSPVIGFGGSGTALNDAMTANFSGTGAPTGFGPWPAVVQVPATLDGPATNVTVSGGNLTATHSTTTSNSGVRSTALKSSGKYYFEATFGATNGTNDCVALMTWAATYANIVTNSTNAVTLYATANGLIWTNGGDSGKTLGSNIVAGDVIAVAVDLDNAKIWFRNNHGGSIGNWNGDPTADPATNTNGVAIPTTAAVSPAVGFGGNSGVTGQIGDNITANFGQSAYVMTPPSGFANNWTT